MALKVPTIFTAVDKMSAPVARMQKNVHTFGERASAGIARFDRGLRRLTPSLGAVGKQMLAFAGTGLVVAGIGKSVATLRDFEQANADLAAVASSATRPQLEALRADAARLGGITAKTATEVVGLQEAFARLGFETNDILNMTEGTIAGSIAMNAELAETAELGGAMVRTFKTLESQDMPQIMDQMTLATQRSALNFSKLQTSLPIVAGAANAAGIGFEELMALLGKLSDSGIDASSSANALKRIFIESKAQGLNYGQILEKIKNSQDKLTFANTEFGARAAVSGTILAEQIDQIAELTKDLERAKKGGDLFGAAQKAANERLDTFSGALTLLSSKWDGFLIQQNDGIGALGVLNKAILWLTDNLEMVVGVIAGSLGLWIGLRGAVFGVQSMIWLYNTAIGVAGALTGKASIAIGGNTAALTAYNIATKAAAFFTGVWSAAQTALNFIMNLNPIFLIITGVALLTAGIIYLVNKYKDWIKSLWIVQATIKAVSVVFDFIADRWNRIVDGFTKGGIVEGIKQIGLVLLDNILLPLNLILKLASKLPGKAGNLAESMQGKIAEFRASLETPSETPAVNPKSAEQEALTQKIEQSQKSNATLTINDPQGRTTVEKDKNFMPIITSTMGAI